MMSVLDRIRAFSKDKKTQVVLFSSTAIALYGYDQGMMSLVNTNRDYLNTMGISETDPLVGIIVSVYYLGCAVGAVFFSYHADKHGRKKAMSFCLATASLGNGISFIAGLGDAPGALWVMLFGRVVMGLGVGGIDSVVPVYSSELSEDEARGRALAQEFQMNIFGLNMAFAINLALTVTLGKDNQWAWRVPIICMQLYPLLLFAFIERLPESPRWFVYHDMKGNAKASLKEMYEEEEADSTLQALVESHDKESGQQLGYVDMLKPGGAQFHPTVITVMAQVNQALTGYGAVSVYGPQIFELLGFGVRQAEYLTQGNYISYLLLMTVSWILIDVVGRRKIMVDGSVILTASFLLLALLSGLAMSSSDLHIPVLAPAVPGILALYVATGAFGIGWLATVWLIPTEIYPTVARAQGTAVSVIVWGLANFAVTLLTPLLFNNLKYWIFVVFAGTNALAGLWTYLYLPESGGRSFQENQAFFEAAAEKGSWRVAKVLDGEFLKMPSGDGGGDDANGEDNETRPLLSRVRDQFP